MRLSRLGRGLALAALLGGCAGRAHEGRPPAIAALAGLTQGVSTRADIIAALGTPEGHGLFAEAGAPTRDILVYEENTYDHGAVGRKRLLVFIDQASDRFAGYWWYRGDVVLGRAP